MRHRAHIGIEVSREEVRGASVRQVGGSLQVNMVAAAPLPPNAVDAEGMLDIHAVSEVVRSVAIQLDPKATLAALGVTGCNLVARVMEIPPVPDGEVRSVLRGEMDHFRILPAGQSAFDYYRLPDAPKSEHDGSDDPVARLLLMGAEDRIVAGYRDVVGASGLGLVSVEPGAVSVLRSLYPIIRNEEAVATVALSAKRTDIFITQLGDLQFYRQVDTGIADLRTSTGLADSGATRGVGSLLVQSYEVAQDGDSEASAEPQPESAPVQQYNRQAIALLITEIQRSIDYYLREYPQVGEKMQVRFVLDAADSRELFAIFKQHLRSDAELVCALDVIQASPEATGAMSGQQPNRYTVAVGLALIGAPGDFSLAPALDLSVADRVVVEGRMSPRYLTVSFAAAGLILFGTMAAAILVGRSIGYAEQRLKQHGAELQALTQEHAALVAQQDRQKALLGDFDKRNRPIKEAVEFLASSIAPRACITNLSINQEGRVMMSGEAASPRVVADIMDTVNMTPVLDPVRLLSLTALEANTSGQRALRFELETGFSKVHQMAESQPAAGSAPPAAANIPAQGGT